MAEKLKVTLVKSTIGAIPKHRATVEALGLRSLVRQLNCLIMMQSGAWYGM